MSRYTGPRLKVLRALGVDLPGLTRKSMQDRPNPPGQHGARKVQARKSEFGLQLMEKQKLRYHYGLTERQSRRVVAQAKRQPGATGARILATMAYEMQRREGRYALETMCIGGGQGLAAVFERVA